MSTLPQIAIEDPTKIYARPEEVVNDPRLSFEEKVAVLDSWAHLAGALAVATEEGMTGGEPSRLTEVAEARARLGAASNSEQVTAPTKQGNKLARSQ